MRVLVVSDLHIWGADDPLYASLLQLARSLRRDDTFVLAGDIFDVFVAKKKVFLAPYQEFWKALGDAVRAGAEVHYIEGNHDFHMKSALRKIHGLHVHGRDVKFQRKGKRFLIAHGDLADSRNRKYRALRILFRSPVMKLVVNASPGSLVKNVGERMSRFSRGRKPLLPQDLPAESLKELRKRYRNFAAERALEGFDFIIMGHCHDLDEMHFQVSGKTVQYVNVGYPRVHRSYLEWTPEDSKIRRVEWV